MFQVALLGCVFMTPVPYTGQANMTILVPAYFYPGGEGKQHWDHLIASATRADIVAIANPGNGPGERADSNYESVIRRARSAGVKIIGYVYTKYGKRATSEVEADMDRWLRFYPQIHGFLIDEQASDEKSVDYYAKLYRYVRTKLPSALVIGNPGTECAEEFAARPAADVSCVFENEKGFDVFRAPAWAQRFDPGRFAALAYNVSFPATMRAYVKKAERDRVRYFYVTDAKGPNPWDRLPAYWDAEVDELRRSEIRSPTKARDGSFQIRH